MKIGTQFNNGSMRLTCLAFYGTERRNVGLFVRESDGMYITARDTFLDRNGQYSWAWGHYFTDDKIALQNYKTRVVSQKTQFQQRRERFNILPSVSKNILKNRQFL